MVANQVVKGESIKIKTGSVWLPKTSLLKRVKLATADFLSIRSVDNPIASHLSR